MEDGNACAGKVSIAIQRMGHQIAILMIQADLKEGMKNLNVKITNL